MKRILILYSAYTGNGHKSIADALTERLNLYPDVEVHLLDGFSLIGKAGIEISKMYGPMTRGSKQLWELAYALSDQSGKALDNALSSMVHKRFVERLRMIKPHLIVSVHALFNGCLIDILEYYGLDIPFVTLEADIINIHSNWCDPRATLTMCPTIEAYHSSIRHGMPEGKLLITGFPTRAQFCESARTCTRPDYDGTHPMRVLMMSGGEGSGNMLAYAEAILSRTACHLSIVCGRNQQLKNLISGKLEARYSDRFEVYGFVSDLSELMAETDLFITRGSPNALMEAVVMNVPIIVTGSLPGQEADNPTLVAKHNLGVLCTSPAALPMIIESLTRDGCERLRDIRNSQRAYRDLDNAKNIAKRLYEMTVQKERFFPPAKRYYPVPYYTRKIVKRLKS